MFHRRVCPRRPSRTLALRPFAVGLTLLLIGAPGHGAPVAPKTAARRAAPVTHSKNVHSATVTAIDDTMVHATLPDGTALDAEIRPSSVFLRGGQAASGTDFKPGTPAVLRTRTRASDGTVSLVLLCDPATQTAIDTYRRRPLVGNIVSLNEKTLVVKPQNGGNLLLTLRLTPKTAWRRKGADATPAAFPPGLAVTILTRGLPSGLLMANIVSDSGADAQAEKAALKPVSLVGVAADVQPEKSLLTIAPKSKPRRTVAITDDTKVKVERADATLRQVTPGMRVSARLGHQKDADGHLIATSLSAYALTPNSAHKKVTAIKTP